MQRMTKALTAILAMAFVAVLLGIVVSGPATAADDDKKKDAGIAVGLRPATAKGGDTSRAFLEYEIPPRGTVVDYVAVSNLRSTPITVRLFAKDATTTTDTPFSVQESAAVPKDVGSWMSLKKDRITLPPRSETVVPFQVGVPHNASPGDHVGAIVVSLLAREPKPEGGTIVVDHRVGMRVLLRVPGDYKPALTVTDLKASWDSPGTVLGRGETEVTYTVRNSGNLRVSATGDLKLSRVAGLPAVEARTAPIAEIQPGGEIEVRQVVKGVFGTGPMKAAVTLDPVPLDPKLKEVSVKSITSTTSFSAWPWLFVGVVLAIVLVAGAGGRLERRRRRARRDAAAPTGGKYRAPVDGDARPSGKRVMVRGVAVVAVLSGMLLGAGPVHAADDISTWQAKLSIQKGTDNAPLDLLTSGGCPLPGTNVVGFAFGSGFPKEGGIIVGNGDAGVDARGPFRMPLVASLAQLMNEQPEPKPFSGVYRLELRCITPGMDKTTGKYVVAIRFKDGHSWKVAKALTTAQGPTTTTTGSAAPGSTDPEDSRAGSTPGAQKAPNAPSAEELAAAEKRANELAGINQETAGESGDGPSWPLIGGGVLVLLATGGFLLRRRNA